MIVSASAAPGAFSGRSVARSCAAHRPEGRRRSGGEIALLPRILRPVVELRLRSLDVLVRPVGQRREVAPAEVEARVERLGVETPLRATPLRPRRRSNREQRLARRRERELLAEESGHRGKDVDETGGSGDALAGPRAARELDEERNPELLAVEKDPVLVLAVVAEPFAVIGEEDDDRPVVDPFRLQESEKASEDRVRGRDLSVVGAARVAALEGLGGIVRRVRLVEMEEREQRLVRRLRADPRLEDLRRDRSAPLDAAQGLCRGAHLDVVAVLVEALRDSGRVVEDEGGDGAPRRITALPEEARERVRAGREAVADVVPHPVLIRKQAREERRVRRQSQGNRRQGVLEDHGVLLQGVEARRLDVAIPVCGQVVGAEGVDRHEDHGSARVNGARPRATARAEERDEQCGPFHATA